MYMILSNAVFAALPPSAVKVCRYAAANTVCSLPGWVLYFVYSYVCEVSPCCMNFPVQSCCSAPKP